MRESAATKAVRYLAAGRLIVRQVDERTGVVQATSRGDGTVYTLGHGRRDGWRCDCPARGRCAHLLALGLVVAVRREAS